MSLDPHTEIARTKASASWLSGVGGLLTGVAAVGTLILTGVVTLLIKKPAETTTPPAENSKQVEEPIVRVPDSAPTAPPVQVPAEPQPAPRPRPKPPVVAYNEKYLDTNAVPAKDRTNLSVFVRLPVPSQINTVQGVLQRSLRERGDNVIALFRDAFSSENLDLQLFEGNPTLAKRLELRKYCDKVLLGVVRFAGPAENQSHSGLYMREAILNLHAIAADTGELLEDIEISAKGRGPDEDASTRDALRALEGSIEERIK